MWDFSTEPEYAEQLRWVDQFVRDEVEPVDVLFPSHADPYDRSSGVYQEIIRPLQDQVKSRGSWAAHLSPELGGQGLGQVKLGLLNEILGRSLWAPSVFGTQAPDSGNAEILAHYGTPEQRDRYLKPLLAGDTVSTYAMTEPQGGSDPGGFTTRAVRDGDTWVINGEKWFASNYPFAAFVIVMVITNPHVRVHQGSSMFLVPAGTPGMELIRLTGTDDEPVLEGTHGYIRFTDCRVPADHLLGPEGAGFEIAQKRLGDGRLHHAMRTVGNVNKALEMMTERINSRQTRGGPLADQQVVRHQLADSFIELQQFRLQVLYAAWHLDRANETGSREDLRAARLQISAVKAATPKILVDVMYRVVHLHGAYGISNELPLMRMWGQGPMLAVTDGPTEAHKDVVARLLLNDAAAAQAEPADPLFGSRHLPTRIAAAREKLAGQLERLAANQ